MAKRTFTKYPNSYVKASDISDALDREQCRELAVDIFIKKKNGEDFIAIANELGLSVNNVKQLYNSIGAGCNIQFIVYPNDTANGTIGRTGQIYTPGEI